MADLPDSAAGDSRSVLSRPAPPPQATLRYGPLPDQVADLRLPRRPPEHPVPLVVVVHGGFWRAAYDRAHTAPLADDLAARGHPVAQLEYRRTGQPGGGWPGTFDDVAAGIAALPRLAVAAGAPVDPGPPVLLGHSAGGQLVLWYAAGNPVRGVLALAPVADLALAYRLDLDGGAVADLLGGGPEQRPQRYARVDPARLPAPPAPTVIIHGTRDRQVPIELSRSYQAATGGRARLVEPAVDHFAVIDPQAAAWPTVVAALRSAFG